MKLISGKYRLNWVDGVDIYGRPVKYQSLTEVEVVPEVPKEPTYYCYHEWEVYEGFLIKEKKCLKCGELVVLNGNDV